ncbi:glycoside hydrolase family 127 protein [Parvularcula dongshanensis]|uniref:Glycoside hydrolase family 127 protein n=1 Tax=Parvularcula dongshanensis TaxID=1173995 RepID=A0A840I498_9PROT|nr:glycoside hydrolase family 127 protein [Parvularcula dongshanensis]MBB4659689.1 hypothetical protein [Parvularcula dongshanensis]
MQVDRRAFLISTSAVALAGSTLAAAKGVESLQAVPLEDVALTPSIFSRSVETNTRVLLELEPDRLLHNFRKFAGLEPKGELYGGWEARGIAGHSLGHYLTALAITAQRGHAEARDRVRYIVAEMAACQIAHGDGYVGGTTAERDDEIVDGKVIFEEIRRGDIRTSGFDINGGWVPLYTWDKVQTGLIDAYRLAGEEAAMPVLIGMAGYLADVLDQLDDEQMQTLLAAEHGGLNGAYAELYALTGEKRWLALAERLRHRAVLDPLSRGQDILPGLHANTQIPKLLGLARLHELTGEDAAGDTARFFYRTVTDQHSYVIGGNSEREHFRAPGVIAEAITDRTCEACNSYNMLKMARHLWQWEPDAKLFDEYERTYINHILAHQHPVSGMYVYFMPLRSGSRRTYSTLENSFWCCMGTGMESHAKHGDSAFWQQGGEAFYINLFVPAEVRWREGDMRLRMETDFPRDETVSLVVEDAPRRARTLAVRLPGWCEAPHVTLNGERVPVEPGPGYARLARRWKPGDRIEARFPMRTTVERTPDDESMIAFLHGPLVLAADLGPDDRSVVLPPALVTADAERSLEPIDSEPFSYRLTGAVPEPIVLRPFFDQYDNRTAVYFPRFTAEAWKQKEVAFRAEQKAQRALEARTFDVIYLGEMQPERDHDFEASHADVIAFGGRNGRTAWWGVGNYIQFDLAVGEGPVVLRALYWGEETGKDFDISVDGTTIARERRDTPSASEFVAVDYEVPDELTRGKSKVTIRFQTRGSDAPVYEVRTLLADAQ